MPKTENFAAVFARLKAILQEYEPRLIVKADEPGNYSLNAPIAWRGQSEFFFAAVQTRKNYVSFQLMPVYSYPDLLEGTSEGLRKRMQGKSCFNFRGVEEDRFAELAGLVQKGITTFQERGLPTQ